MIKDIDDNRIAKVGLTINEQNEIIISDENAFSNSFNNKNICSKIRHCEPLKEAWQSRELQDLTDEGIIFIFN